MELHRKYLGACVFFLQEMISAPAQARNDFPLQKEFKASFNLLQYSKHVVIRAESIGCNGQNRETQNLHPQLAPVKCIGGK